jgi:large-conductance mechanosensitive channel
MICYHQGFQRCIKIYKHSINGSFIPIGSLFTASLNFVMVGVVMFFVIKAYGRFRKGETAETTNDLLASIRDELRKNRVE